MQKNQDKTGEDISKIIEETAKTESVVSKDIAQKEEKIAKAVSKIPATTDIIEERKRKVVNFIKKKKEWLYYLILAILVFIGTYIRTLNIDKLKDVTNGSWTLGPDLDPFLFLRWAEYIVEHGKLMTLDLMRNVPLGFPTGSEMGLLPYMMAWFYNFMHFFNSAINVTYASIWFPVFMFGLTTIAFFLFARKVFYKEDKTIKNLIALIATAFFILIPSLLPRTIAGIPEKESVAFFFIFLAFYFFLESFTAIKIKRALIFGILAGIATGLLALIWGGVTYVFITIAGAVLFAFLLGKIKKKEFYAYALWIIGFSLTMIPFSLRYDLRSLISSTSTGIAIGVFFILLIDFAFGQFSFSDKIYSRWKKVPKEIISIIISGILLIALASIVLGPSFISHISKDIIEQTVHPLEISRWGLTVAENKQPYFINDWKDNFGPVISGIPLYFWLFFIGSIYLFNYLIKSLNKKEKLILNFAYFIFLISLIFSRYSSGSILNGDTGLSFVVYFGGAILFLISFAYVYFKRHANDNFEVFKEFDIAYILYFIILTIAIIGARGAIRLIMVLGAVTPLVVSSFNVKLGQRFFNEKGGMIKLVIGIILLIVALSSLFTIWTYYKSDKAIGENFAPGPYQWQWQKAMQWVRNNVPENAVFAHWWDYGYWVQSIGQRSTILDGGNAIVYWNYLMGRHVLTAPTDAEGLEFLYSHNATHLLIDSTEIGKYTAFSSIGSDENYDRYSWLSVFLMDDSQTRETNNETMYVYPGGTLLDGDIIWKQDGKDILLPKKKAGIGAIILIKDSKENYLQPNAIFIYGGQQYKIPLKYLFIENNLKDFGSGLEAGVFTFSRIDSNSQGGINLNMIGSAIYLSEKTINSNLARLYLFGQDSKYFKLIHSQPSYINEVLNQQGAQFGDFVFYQGFQGPIKIWEINYPEGIKSNPEYLEKGFPNKELTLAKPGEY